MPDHRSGLINTIEHSVCAFHKKVESLLAPSFTVGWWTDNSNRENQFRWMNSKRTIWRADSRISAYILPYYFQSILHDLLPRSVQCNLAFVFDLALDASNQILEVFLDSRMYVTFEVAASRVALI